jgi:3-dehydroquinate synthase
MLGENIILIGMPGSGKTTVGKDLAKQLGMPFIDTDTLIEQISGMPIPEIFAGTGEENFRSIEREAIKKIAKMRNIVVATGGGSWCDIKNRRNLVNGGRVFFLDCRLEELWNRLNNSHTTRPLLSEGFAGLERLHKIRRGSYLRAQHIIDTYQKTPGEVAESIAAYYKNEYKKSSPSIIYNRKVTVGSEDCEFFAGIGILDRLGGFLKGRYSAKGTAPKLLIVTNPYVNALCGGRIIECLESFGFTAGVFVVPEGEAYKTTEWVQKIYSHLVSFDYDRGDVVLALGGGVIGDLAGFAAATYMRGMALVQLPTTLLAQVDSSIGGKTAVNLPEGKNLVGAFHQPEMVVSDTCLLKHLSEKDYRQGLAECVKYGLIDNKGFFEFLEQNQSDIRNRQPQTLGIMTAKCCDIKTDIVREDEKERGVRAILNLGHTVGHALEAAAGYGSIGHGDAVALGIRVKVYISLKMGFMNKRDYDRVLGMLEGFEFPAEADVLPDSVMVFITRDKKKKRGRIWFVMPKGIGGAELVPDIPERLLMEGLGTIGIKQR